MMKGQFKPGDMVAWYDRYTNRLASIYVILNKSSTHYTFMCVFHRHYGNEATPKKLYYLFSGFDAGNSVYRTEKIT